MCTSPGATSASPRTQRDNDAVKKAATLIGVGPVTASAVVATVGEFNQFTTGAQFGAWIGLVPRQHSSGGKNSLGSITKRGDTYLRSLLIQGAKSAVMTAHKRSDPISKWAAALRDRAGWQKAVVALANKNARILWAVMTKGDAFNARHVSVKPGALPTTTPRDGHRVATNDPITQQASARRRSNRSDRQRASSTNPWWLDSSMST